MFDAPGRSARLPPSNVQVLDGEDEEEDDSDSDSSVGGPDHGKHKNSPAIQPLYPSQTTPVAPKVKRGRAGQTLWTKGHGWWRRVLSG